MSYLLLGGAGLLVLRLFDLAALFRRPLLKPLAWTIGTGLLVYAAVMTTVSGNRIALPDWLAWSGAALLAASLCGLAYALFFALPFRQTYLAAGPGHLVESGLYRLVRHPWLFFFAASLAGLALLSRSELTALAAVCWTALCIPLVYVQDRFIFGRLFPGYAAYRKRTPMLLPTLRSVRAFISQRKPIAIQTTGG